MIFYLGISCILYFCYDKFYEYFDIVCKFFENKVVISFIVFYEEIKKVEKYNDVECYFNRLVDFGKFKKYIFFDVFKKLGRVK